MDGAFDPIHVGHLAYFRAARSLGYPLLCNICPDQETAQKHPVLLPAQDRAQILDSLDILTYVHVSERPTVEILRQLRPAYYVKGADWADKLPIEQGQVCDELGIRIRYTDTQQGSSTALLKRLQPDVDAFERLVQGQWPASTPWAPVLPWDFESRVAVEGKHPDLIAEVFAGHKVLDAGCGAGHLVRLLIERGMDARGFDLAPQTGHPWFFAADLSNAAELFDGEYGDLVIAREVLEHLTIRQLRRAVTNLCRLSMGFVYVTTRFARQPAHLLSVDTSDDLDPDHRTMLHPDFLRTLFVLEGFKRRADLEQRLDHKNLGRVLVYERG